MMPYRDPEQRRAYDREGIVNAFGHHANLPRVERALSLLLAAVLARPERRPTGGRPREAWRAA